HAGLSETVLPHGGVENQKNVVDRRLLLDHTLDLAELVHQTGLGVQAAGGVDQNDVDALLDATSNGVEGNSSGIAAFLSANNLSADALGPRLQLIGRSSTERVSGTKKHPSPVSDQYAGQLARRGGLAGSVHTDDKQNRRMVVVRKRPDR